MGGSNHLYYGHISAFIMMQINKVETYRELIIFACGIQI
jgi:hypothetical protein